MNALTKCLKHNLLKIDCFQRQFFQFRRQSYIIFYGRNKVLSFDCFDWWSQFLDTWNNGLFFLNKSFLACTSKTILHLSDKWSPSQKTHFLPLPSIEWSLLPLFLNFLFSLWTDDKPDTKDEPVYGVWDAILSPKSFLSSAVVCDGTIHATWAFNSTLIRSRILVKF